MGHFYTMTYSLFAGTKMYATKSSNSHLKRVSPVNDFLFVHLADRCHDVSAEALVKGQHGGGVPQHFDHRVEALRPRGRKRSGKECTVHRKDEVT